MNINWELMGRVPDFGEIVRKGMAQGRETSRQWRQDNALAALAQNPDNERALAELAAVDLSAASKFQDLRYDVEDRRRKSGARQARADYMLADQPGVRCLRTR